PPGDPAPFPTPVYWLVLRQGGLRDDLLALAAARGVPGWFDPPLALFQDLPDLLAELPQKPVGDFERVVLVTRALRESAGPAFRGLRNLDAYANAVDRWIGELVGEGIDVPAVRAWHEATPRDAFGARRDGELIATYARYLQLLAEAGLRDPRARLCDVADRVRTHAGELPERLGGRRELRLVGLSDPRGGWPRLLEALAACPALDRVAIYAADRLSFVAALAADVIDLDRVPHFTTRVLGPGADERVPTGEASRPGAAQLELLADPPPAEAALPHVELLSAPDLPREVEEIAVRVRALIDAGTPPQRIAVIARSARPYSSHVLRALDRLGVPASARRRHALPEVPAVRALLALFGVAAAGWERLGLVELAETPYFRARLDAGVLNHIGYQRRVQGLAAWRDALRTLAERAARRERLLVEDPDNEDARRNPMPSHERVRTAAERFEGFAQRAAALDEARSIAHWLQWLATFLEEDPWRLERTLYRVPASRYDAVRLDTAAWRGMRDIVAQWAAAERRWGSSEPLDVRSFETRLRATLSGDVALFTPARRGVQVLEGLAAAFRSFDHGFLVGLDAARVPLRAPRSPLLDEQDRLSLREGGLPIDTRAQWEEREQALFRNLLACASSSLTLSFARYDETGAEQLPSAFLEEVQYAFGLEVTALPGSRAFTPAMPLVAGAVALEHAALAAHAERARLAGAASPYHGRIEHEDARRWLAAELGEARVWSPTQIEAYAKCPWAYFSGRLLHLEQLDDPDLDIDPRTRGSILHDALRRFYEAARGHARPPIHLRTADLDWARPLAGRAVGAAIEHARETLWVGHPALEAQKLAELKRQLVGFIEWEAEDNERNATNPRVKAAAWVQTGVIEHEVSFDDVALEIDGERVRFRGFIDRVEQGMDARGGSEQLVAAVDYKTTVYSTPAGGKKEGWEDGVVLQVPLYAYALTRIRPGSAAARVEYRAIKKPARAHTLPLYRYEKQAGLVADAEQVGQYQAALHDVVHHVVAARAGQFPPDPPPSCNCPPFCHARDICRVPGGPRGGW
ncbi:MAG TPA: PD-(D/E)XK nuclease family protein, partial [Longimicrobiales bacterium]|nr:PD-(D/E)XK nuclease family protein [Longimicrobiales bacterium]